MRTETLLASWTRLQQALPDEILEVIEQHTAAMAPGGAGAPAVAAALAGADIAPPPPAPSPPSAEQLTAKLITGLMHHFIAIANAQIGPQMRTLTIDVFGKTDNHLDPLDFNGHVQTSTDGSACLPRACTSIPWIGEICMPPFEMCASGGASAGLNSISGLSTVLISSIDIAGLGSAADDTLIASGQVVLTAHELTADGFAEAHGGPFGISIPVDASGSATLTNLRVDADIRIEIAVDVPTFRKIDLDNLKLGYGGLNIDISGLGPFNGLIGPLVDGVKSLITPLFDVNGAIAGAVKGTVEDQLNNALVVLDQKLADALA